MDFALATNSTVSATVPDWEAQGLGEGLGGHVATCTAKAIVLLSLNRF